MSEVGRSWLPHSNDVLGLRESAVLDELLLPNRSQRSLCRGRDCAHLSVWCWHWHLFPVRITPLFSWWMVGFTRTKSYFLSHIFILFFVFAIVVIVVDADPPLPPLNPLALPRFWWTPLLGWLKAERPCGPRCGVVVVVDGNPSPTTAFHFPSTTALHVCQQTPLQHCLWGTSPLNCLGWRDMIVMGPHNLSLFPISECAIVRWCCWAHGSGDVSSLPRTLTTTVKLTKDWSESLVHSSWLFENIRVRFLCGRAWLKK